MVDPCSIYARPAHSAQRLLRALIKAKPKQPVKKQQADLARKKHILASHPVLQPGNRKETWAFEEKLNHCDCHTAAVPNSALCFIRRGKCMLTTAQVELKKLHGYSMTRFDSQLQQHVLAVSQRTASAVIDATTVEIRLHIRCKL